jgi:hypothetical protein
MSVAVTELPVSPNGIFLSYSHQDSEAALKLKGELEGLGVAVRLDSEAMRPGQEIREFILQSIRATVATVWVVSEDSLTSDWVALEITTSLRDAELWNKRTLVACYVDEGFLKDDELRLRATEKIDRRIAAIDDRIRQYSDKHIDTNDFNAEKSRLHQLRAELGTLLEHLKGSLCLDIRAGMIEASVPRLAKTLGPLSPPIKPALLAATDLGKRHDEVENVIVSGELERGLNLLMDFIKDFSDARRRREVLAIVTTFRTMEKVPGVRPKEIIKERERLLKKAFTLLDDAVEQLTRKVA